MVVWNCPFLPKCLDVWTILFHVAMNMGKGCLSREHLCAAQVAGKLDDAVKQLQKYTEGGLPAPHYGSVPGLPALATSGMEMQLCFVHLSGKVRKRSAASSLSLREACV